MLTRDNFGEVMAGIAGLFQVNLTSFMLDTYYEIFKDYSDEQFKAAIVKTIKEHKYHTFPKPAEILEYLEGTRDDKSLIAWLQVKEAIEKGGYYASIDFADSIIPAVIENLGGWQWLCCSEKDEEPFIQKRFMELYSLFIKQGRGTQPVKVIGWLEAQNNKSGYLKEIPKPIRIGYKNEQLELIHQTAKQMGEK